MNKQMKIRNEKKFLKGNRVDDFEISAMGKPPKHLLEVQPCTITEPTKCSAEYLKDSWYIGKNPRTNGSQSDSSPLISVLVHIWTFFDPTLILFSTWGAPFFLSVSSWSLGCSYSYLYWCKVHFSAACVFLPDTYVTREQFAAASHFSLLSSLSPPTTFTQLREKKEKKTSN